jgi:hypothetical protein
MSWREPTAWALLIAIYGLYVWWCAKVLPPEGGWRKWWKDRPRWHR